MTALCTQKKSKIRILHELPHRLRIRASVLHDPAFDPAYMEAVLQNLPGVEDVSFNIKAASVAIRYDGSSHSREKILFSLENIPAETFQPGIEKEPPSDAVGVASNGILALLTPIIPGCLKPPLSWTISFPTLMKGINSLINGGINIEVLDASAVGFSLLRRDYFTANTIVFLLALGRYIEQLSDEKTDSLLKSLLRPQSENVWAERNGQEIKVSLSEINIGDTVICGTGEMIPVDGETSHGDALVNQSSITGESIPVHVQPGDRVLSGSVIEEGRIKIAVTQVGTETTTARISRFLENSLRFKSRQQKQSDILADKLVPVTFALGLAIWLITRDIRRAAAVLTVDYSCAIKLASPVAVKMSMFNAAHCGVLIKGSQALDALSRVDTIVFDKTGTLTRGVLKVTDIFPLNNLNKEKLLALAAAAEEHYTHPVAVAVAKAAHDYGLKIPSLSQVDFIVAHGVSAYVEDERVLVGSHHFIAEDEGISCSAAETIADEIRQHGKSLLYVARGDVLEGVIALQDELRPEAPDVIKRLKKLGIKKIVILTGDHRDTAKAMTNQLEAVDEVHWELKPEDKSAIVADLRSKGHVIAFAGDGVNDAPALVTADVGICMPGGADLARESAQVVLLKEDLNALATAKEIADKTEMIIRNCFKSAVGFNSVLLLMAVCGILPPVASAILHNANTVGILGYAALAGKQPPSSLSKAEPQEQE